jgi:hypothetical protein
MDSAFTCLYGDVRVAEQPVRGTDCAETWNRRRRQLKDLGPLSLKEEWSLFSISTNSYIPTSLHTVLSHAHFERKFAHQKLEI